MFSLIRRLFRWYITVLSKAVEATKQTVFTFFAFIVILLVLLWMSIFLYGSFYYNYIPADSHVKDVNFHFSSNYKKSELGSYPEANLSLITDNRQQLLAAGQAYRVALFLEMPESPVNQALGMFMVKLSFYTRHGELVQKASRASMLRYKSSLLQIFETVFSVPFMLIGFKEQKQDLEVELVANYNQDPYKPALGVHIEIESRRIEIYSAELRIDAQFTGVRYILYQWPILSALFGISLNMTFLSLVALLSWYNLTQKGETTDSNPQPVLYHTPSPSVSTSVSQGTENGKEENLSQGSSESDDFTDIGTDVDQGSLLDQKSTLSSGTTPENLSAMKGAQGVRHRAGVSTT